MAFWQELKKPRDLFFRESEADAALECLRELMHADMNPDEQRAALELEAIILRSRKQYREAIACYQRIPDHYQAGYCAMLLGDTNGVQQHWTQLVNVRPNHWCMSLFGLVTRQLRTYPTLFQIRNHLESDIANLIAAGQEGFLESLLSYMDFLTQLNLESPKFVGRSLMHAGRVQEAGPYLYQGQKTLPNDPEIYFHLGQYSVAKGQLKEARLVLNQCLLISPAYTPARDLLATLLAEGSPS